MAPPAGPPGPAAKFPSTSDFNQVFNRINLSLSKHNSFLQTIRARHPQPAEPATTSTSATTGAGFSYLASKSSSSTTKSASSASLLPHRKTQADLDAEEAQFAEHSADVAAAFGPGGGGSNAGIGYVPERKAVDRARDDKDLRGRLLGKRAREQLDEAAAARKKHAARRGESSDDEDEVGRSGLGRSKKMKKTTMTMATSTQPQQLGEDDDEAGDGEQTATLTQVVTGQTVTKDGSQERAVAKVTSAANESNEVNSGSLGEEQVNNMSGDGDKKKRKKKKKKGKKGNDGET